MSNSSYGGYVYTGLFGFYTGEIAILSHAPFFLPVRELIQNEKYLYYSYQCTNYSVIHEFFFPNNNENKTEINC